VATVPNLVSCLRLLLIPVLIALAKAGHSQAFFWLLVSSLATDALDGLLARKLNQITELGSKLDSWADFTTYLSLPLCAWWLRPEVLRAEAPFLVAAMLFYLAAVSFGFVKFHRLTSYHTWLSKSLAILAGGVVLVLFAGGPGWPLRVLAPIVMVSCVEEMVITALLPRWRANVPSVFHALRLKRELVER